MLPRGGGPVCGDEGGLLYAKSVLKIVYSYLINSQQNSKHKPDIK